VTEAHNRLGDETVKQIRETAFRILESHNIHQPALIPRDPGDIVHGRWDIPPTSDTSRPLGHIAVALRSPSDGYLHDTDLARLTVLAIADWDEKESPPKWQAAAVEIKIAVDDMLLDRIPPGPDIDVELMRTSELRYRHIHAVDEELYQAYRDNVDPKVSDAIRSVPGAYEHLVYYGVDRLGFSKDDPAANPNTLVIGVDLESDEACWPAMLAAVRTCLEDFPFHIEVLIWRVKQWGDYPVE
jgi:hypothetical protein